MNFSVELFTGKRRITVRWMQVKVWRKPETNYLTNIIQWQTLVVRGKGMAYELSVLRCESIRY